MIGIISAMRPEASLLIRAVEEPVKTERGSVRYISGKISGKDVVLCVCGVGKVSAAGCTQQMIDRFSPSLILNTGIAGTLTEKLGIGDLAVGERVCEHDMDTSPLGDPPGFISGINRTYFEADREAVRFFTEAAKEFFPRCLAGTIASGDQFIADTARREYIVRHFGAIACEMEGGAIGHIAYANRVPFVVLRCISDGAGSTAPSDYIRFVAAAARSSAMLVKEFLSR